MGAIELLQPIGNPDLLLVNADRQLRGLPPGEMEWVCQHSCAPESIPDCEDFNCEGTLIVDRGQLEDVRELVARGDLAAFDGVQVQLKLDVPRGVGTELQRFARSNTEMPAIQRRGREFETAGSLLAFARLCARRIDPNLSERAATVILEIERVVTGTFSTGGPALFDQRFVDLRTRLADRGNTITVLARAGWPGQALVAWEEPQPQRRRVNVVPPAISQANAGFGLWLESGHGIRLGRTKSGLAALPGDLYGPTSRLVFRVDQEVADRVRSRCEELEAAQPAPPLDEPILELLLAITRELGLSAPILPPATGREESSCVRPAQFIRCLLLAQPLPSVHTDQRAEIV
jgi:hypothetical protein